MPMLDTAMPNRASARRGFLRNAGFATIGAMAASALPKSAAAATAEAAPTATDIEILNFALNLEYLEAEFYLTAATGSGIPATDLTGTGTQGAVTGGHKVPFSSAGVKAFATDIAGDELNHVRFLRAALGSQAVAQPAIDFQQSFTTLAQAAGVVPAGQHFSPFASDLHFLIGAFIFEDVGVTAYHGAAALFSSADLISYATGIAAVEAYHAGSIRTMLYNRDEWSITRKIAALRATLDGTESTSPDDSGVHNPDGTADNVVLAPTDSNGIAFSRSTSQVLNIVYGNTTGTKGLFFPNGMNGAIS
jgi:hypothetical protein